MYSNRRRLNGSYHGLYGRCVGIVLGSLSSFGCWIFLVAANLGLGGWATNYLLYVFTGKIIPWFWACCIGLVGGELTMPVAFVIAVLRHFHVI